MLFLMIFFCHIAVKRREAKTKGVKERYTHLNAEFQRIARRDKKAFLNYQCKEIEENNRMGRTRDLFRKRQWYPTPVFLPGKSHGQRSPVGSVHGISKSQTQLNDFTFIHWGWKWQPTPVFLPGESQGRGSLVGCHLWGCTELNTTEVT